MNFGMTVLTIRIFRYLSSVALITAFFTSAACAQPTIEARIDSIKIFFRDGDVGTDHCAALAKILSDSSRKDGLRMLNGLLDVRTTDVIERYRITALVMNAKSLLPDSIMVKVKSL
jgi:hypothetical protein